MQENPQAHARAVRKYWSQTRAAKQSTASSPTAEPKQPSTPSKYERTRVPISPASSPLMGRKTDLASPQRPFKLPKTAWEPWDSTVAVRRTAGTKSNQAVRRAQAYLDRVMEKAGASSVPPPSSDFLIYDFCPRTATLMSAD